MSDFYYFCLVTYFGFRWFGCKYGTGTQGVSNRSRLSWLINSVLVYEPKCGGRVGLLGSQPMSTAVHRSPNKLWRSNSIFNLWWYRTVYRISSYQRFKELRSQSDTSRQINVVFVSNFTVLTSHRYLLNFLWVPSKKFREYKYTELVRLHITLHYITWLGTNYHMITNC